MLLVGVGAPLMAMVGCFLYAGPHGLAGLLGYPGGVLSL